ncbi:MAG: hypothetical protein ACT4PU_04195 [Planctomycetota bacterium]
MSQPPTRILLLAFLVLAGLLILPLLLEGEDGESVAEPEGVSTALPGAEALPSFGLGREDTEGPAPLVDAELAAALEFDGGQPVAKVGGQIKGVLVDALGRPVAGEPVQLLRLNDPWDDGTRRDRDITLLEKRVATAVSGVDGRFELSAVPGIEHALHAGGGRWPRVVLDAIVAGAELRVALSEGYVLQGVVRDASTGLPIVGAPVLVLGEDTALLDRSDESGRIALGPVAENFYAAGAWARGYDILLVPNLSPLMDEPLFELQPGVDARFRVTDRESGLPVAGAEVRFQLEVEAIVPDAEFPLPAKQLVDEQRLLSDAEGGVELLGAPRRGFLLSVTAAGYVPQIIDRYRERDVDTANEMPIELLPLPTLTGHALLAADRAPAPDAVLELSGPQGAFGTATVDEAGAFSLRMDGWDGKRPVYLAATDSTGRAARIDIDLDEVEGLELLLVEPLRLLVRVESGGEPVVGADVMLRSDDALPTRGVSRGGGLVALVHPLAGPETTKALLQGRYSGSVSLPVTIDLAEPPAADEPFVLEVQGGLWLDGQVRDPAGRPIASARISMRPVQGSTTSLRPRGRSDEHGAFRLGPLEAGLVWNIDVSAKDYRNAMLRNVALEGGPLSVVLEPVVRWHGRALDATSGRPARTFTGSLRREILVQGKATWRSMQERVMLTPGEPGAFSIALAEPGRYELRLFAKDCIATEPIVADFDGRREPPEAEFTLWPAAVLELLVLDGRNRPVPGFELVIVPWEAAKDAAEPSGDVRRKGRSVRTDADGRAELNLGEGGAYRTAGGPGAWLDAMAFNVPAGEREQRTYRLPATGDLEVMVNDEAGRPLPGVQVDVRSAKKDTAHSVTRRTSVQGGQASVMVESLPPGTYHLTLRRRNFITLEQEVYVAGNGVQRVVVALQPRPKQTSQAQQGLIQQLQQIGYVR